ncbi:MAG: SBBP repeat-containing protein [Deltaproteobacteria bacterium]|nr:SBBP repeat-containing protein [Deltaproteobacteria bacterium]
MIKFKSDGSDIYYSTYLGGSNEENNSGSRVGIAVDNNGNAYVTGTTRSNDFPTVNALYSNLRGLEDAFVTKINSAGTTVLYSTYLGGSNQEWGNDI